VDTSKPLDQAWLWDVHKLEANTVRTVLIHAMLHTQNTIARPWRRDLKLGAVPVPGGVAVLLQADSPYQGRLEFDIPRHRRYLGFHRDWPRMNTVPEWYTVEPDATPYLVENVASGAKETRTGQQLHEGLPVTLAAGQPSRWIVRRQ